ncbi:hypothetical protein CsSME_00027112 [Camellia sinensis var. sinensis]
MKFFREFGSFCGAATMAAEPAAAPLPRKDVAAPGKSQASSRRSSRPTKPKSTANWKPKLSMISEDGVVVSDNNDRRKTKSTVRCQKKASEKSRSSATARSPSHHNDYGYDSVALPVFSPTPYLF